MLQWLTATHGEKPVCLKCFGTFISALLILPTFLPHFCKFRYSGLRHDEEEEAVQKNHIWLMPDLVLDRPLSLDYLPYIRTISYYESMARQRIKEMTEESMEASRVGRRRTRTSNRKNGNYRRHYLDECKAGKDELDATSLELVLSYGSALFKCGVAS